MIQFKHHVYKKQFQDAPRVLRQIIFDFDWLASKMAIDLTITRIKSKVPGDSGVHLDYRAVDIRDEYKGIATYNQDQRLALFHFINAIYPRDDGYLTCMTHFFNDGPRHWHIQIPYKWKFKESLKIPNK